MPKIGVGAALDLTCVMAGSGEKRASEDRLWSSARSHLLERDDRLARVAPLLAMIADWRGFLNSAIPEEELRDLREHGRTGCPLGSVSFVTHLERVVGRILRPRKAGRPSKLLKQP